MSSQGSKQMGVTNCNTGLFGFMKFIPFERNILKTGQSQYVCLSVINRVRSITLGPLEGVLKK